MNHVTRNNRQRGFTLVEAIVATAVFAFVMSSMVGVYTSAIQLDRKARSQRTVVQNAQYIMDFLAKEIRNGSVDYDAYPGGNTTNENDIRIINQAGEPEIFALSPGCDFESAPCDLTMTKNSVTTTLNSSDVGITNWFYNLSPQEDPFDPALNGNLQPSLTIALEITSNFGRTQDRAKINIQTTLTTRPYPSRQ